MKTFDLIIAGGGMVGASAAIALSQLGLKIALVESNPPAHTSNSSFDQRAVALSAASVSIFKSLGIWDSIKPFSESIQNIHVSDQGHFGFARIKSADYAVEALGEVIPLDQTGPKLWQTIEQSENIEVYSPFELVKMVTLSESHLGPDDLHKRITVTLKNKQDNLEQIISAKLLLGADGTFSSVAKLAGIDIESTNYQQHAIIANIATQHAHDNRAFERFTSSGPLALLPLTQNRLSLVWCNQEDDIEALMACDDNEFRQKLQLAFGYRLGAISKVGARTQYPLALRVAAKPFAEGVLLLGNAAHTLHPIAGQGFNIGIRDVAALADHIERAMETKTTDIGSLEFLQNYQATREKDWHRTISATDWLVRIFSHEFLPVVIARDKALNLIDKLPFLKRQLAYSAMGIADKSAKLTRGLTRVSQQPQK